MKTLPLYSQYIFSLLRYVVNNKHLFTKNLEVHNQELDLLIIFICPLLIWLNTKKGAYYTGIKIFNYLPTHIKNVANTSKLHVFKKDLQEISS
jgi:hypothetical protein